MLFQSEVFVLAFLPLVVTLFYLLNRHSRNLSLVFLVAASVFFYGWHTPGYVVLIGSSILINYAFGWYLSTNRQFLVLSAGVLINITFLFYFKYFDFFVENVSVVLSIELQKLNIVLPLAISFFTFQQIAYLVDSFKGLVKERSFLRYCLFIVFFPQLIAGPILHHSEMMPQFQKALGGYQEKLLNIAIGITIFVIGLMKKILIADHAGRYADVLFGQAENGETLGFLGAWMATIAYSLQIYFDFSGYADMATGLARMFGIILPQNFNSPYKSTNIISFWRRWHMTLSRFFRDYLYLPLGGNRSSGIVTMRNLALVMLLGGLWHGASWTFVVWGGLHGFFLAIAHLWQSFQRRVGESFVLKPLLGWALTMLAVVVAWVPFRAPDLAVTLSVWHSMVGLDGFGYGVAKVTVMDISHFYLAVFPAGFALAVLMPNVYEIMAKYRPVLHDAEKNWSLLDLRWLPNLSWGLAIGIGFLIAFASQTETVEFLYFQF